MSLFAEHQAVRRMIRDLLREEHGETWSATPSVVKFLTSTVRQRLAEFRLRIMGLNGLSVTPDESSIHGAMYDYLDSFGSTIAAGANEIQRNMIAERGLGMPR
jgi:alkylation response protein AidB-like acyl-CoA dehydrogenase